jgi:hypothetical protein
MLTITGANDAIYDMARKGIIGGYEDYSFKPGKIDYSF